MVDNASTDGSLARLREWSGRVLVETIALEQNRGVTAGNNTGIRAGSSEYVALLNPDTQTAPDWLGLLVDVMQRAPDVGLAEARQIPRDLNKFYDPVRGDTSWASTGGVLIRRSALGQVGLFDEQFFMYQDDIDLSWRLWLGGWRCIYVPGSVYSHRPHDGRPPSSTMRFYGTRNEAFMRYLYGSPRLFVDRLWLGLKFAARDHCPELRFATLRAVREAVASLPWLRQRRTALPRLDSPWVGLFDSPYVPRERQENLSWRYAR